MFIEDLSLMQGTNVQRRSTIIAVGWLDCHHPFTMGDTTLQFQNKLGKLSANPVRRMRGFHKCDLCNDDMRGNGEVHVRGSKGKVFVAPALISHYVVVHHYQPPKEFTEAVMADARSWTFKGSLSDAVKKVADEPSHENRDSFYDRFLESRVGIRAPATLGALSPGDYVTSSESKITIPVATLRDGKRMLLVLADVDKLAEWEAATTFLAFNSKDVLQMGLDNHAGIMVQAELPGYECWAGIPEVDVDTLSRRVKK
jgi:SseB protein N-terminal domain